MISPPPTFLRKSAVNKMGKIIIGRSALRESQSGMTCSDSPLVEWDGATVGNDDRKRRV